MKLKNSIILGIILLLTSCAKNLPVIGSGDPEKEFASCMRLASKGDLEDSVQCLEMFKARYPQTKLGQEAELRIGDAYYKKKDYLMAAESYSAYLKLHPRSSRADYAYYRIGMSYLKEGPKAIDRDQEYLETAIDNFRTVVRFFPQSEYSPPAKVSLHNARNRVARRIFYIGKFYYNTGEYLACIPRFKALAEQYPDSGLADLSLYKVVMANLKLGRIDDAKAAYSTLAMSYSDSNYTKKAESKVLSAVRKKK
jgi:outer membrane protein assembly factor BamD